MNYHDLLQDLSIEKAEKLKTFLKSNGISIDDEYREFSEEEVDKLQEFFYSINVISDEKRIYICNSFKFDGFIFKEKKFSPTSFK